MTTINRTGAPSSVPATTSNHGMEGPATQARPKVSRSASAPAALAGLTEKAPPPKMQFRAGTPSKFKAEQEAIAPLIARRSDEQSAFEKWNQAASGRNQGLVHVVDYGYGRPPVSNVDARLKPDAAMGPHKSLPGSVIAAKVGASQASFNPDKLGVVAHGPRYSAEIEARKSALADLRETEKAAGRAGMLKSHPEFQRLNGELRDLQSRSRFESAYVFKTDESKKGRIALADKSAGRPAPEPQARQDENIRPIGRSEINDVTAEMDRLTASSNTTVETKGPSGKSVALPQKWVKTQEASGNQSSRWEQKDETVTDQSITTSHTSNSNGTGLKIQSWGPDGDSLKYSTVMGHSSKT